VVSRYLLGAAVLCGGGCATVASAQVVTHRGFVEGSVTGYPQRAANDTTKVVADFTARLELFVKPSDWLQVAGGLDARANSYDQVDDQWAVDFWARGEQRPRLGVRRLAVTFARGPFTLDLGKQFVRWGTTDFVNPTDRFAPRDFLNVVNPEFLGIAAARAVTQLGRHTIDVVWAPRFFPSRVPLIGQRWAVAPRGLGQLPVEWSPPSLPTGSQAGIRWGHAIGSAVYSLSFFEGNNHLPDVRAAVRLGPSPTESPTQPAPVAVDVTAVHPSIRTYGVDLSLPIRWVTVKAEAAYFTSPTAASDEYGLYVLQLERTSGEWLFLGGYAGEVVTRRRSALTFAPDRGVGRSIVGRVGRTVGAGGNVAVEGAVRQNGHGANGKAEYSHSFGQHWRATATAVGLGGRDDDFFGQYARNSHVVLTLRYSF
jgi:hypothetical protein